MRAKVFREIPKKWFAAYTGQALVFFHPIHAHAVLPRPAPDASKEVHTMSNTTLKFSQAVRARVADVRLLPMGGAACAITGMAVAPTTGVQGTTVPSYTHIVDDVRTGAFPGLLAWSPPRSS
jgi:hypothetical protein